MWTTTTPLSPWNGVMGTGFATGHAAGVAAALSAGKEGYDTEAIRAELTRQGALI